MNKLKLVAAALLTLLFTACHKKHTCTCVLTNNGNDTTVGVGEFNMSKSMAKSKCDQEKTSLKTIHSTGTINCAFK